MLLQGSRIVQRYIDYKKLKRLMKDISGFNASQRMEGGQPMTHIQPKQVHQQRAVTTTGSMQVALQLCAESCICIV